MSAGNARARLERKPGRDILPAGRDPRAVSTGAALAALDLEWGLLFITDVSDDGVWTAKRRDGTGTLISALNPGDLAVRMRADWKGPAW